MLAPLTEVLLDATRGALRLRVEGRSSARGSSPSWLAAASDFEIVGIDGGSTLLAVECPSLLEAAASFFAQESLFHPIDPHESAFGLMEESLIEALNEHSDTELCDQSLLSTFRRFEKVLGGGFDAIELSNGRAGRRARIDRNAIHAVERLIRSTPQPQRVRVSGKLDTIRHSDRMFTLVLDDGKSVKGIADGVAAEQLAQLFGSPVVVSATAVFRPSGSLLRIEADGIERAGDDAELWSRVPTPLFTIMETAALRQAQGPRSGINALLGRWPGEESDEEITRALQELS